MPGHIVSELPALDASLAEFLGALAGDGYVGVRYEVSFTLSNLVDREYALHLHSLFSDLFGICAKMRVQDNRIRIKTYSKRIFHFLTADCGHPAGKKKGRLRMPCFSDDVLLFAYLRGLFDTDGSFYERGSGRGVVNICSLDDRYLHEVAEALRRHGYVVTVSGKDLYIYRRAHVKRFFEEIRPANVKHLRKYALFISRHQ